MATRIKLRSDIAANWAAANPILAAGEIGLVIEGALRRAKVGDGATAWNALDWAFEDEAGGGATAFADLTDKASADLPAINGPLSAALAGKAAVSHSHPASAISDSTGTGRALLTAATPAAARTTLGFDGMVPKIPFTVGLESDFTTTSTSFVNVTGVSFLVEANKRYAVSYYILTNKNDTSGLAIQFTGPTSPTKVSFRQFVATSSFSVNVLNHLTAFSTPSTTMNTFVGDAFASSASGIIDNGANAGMVQLQLRAVTGGTAKIYAGSYIQITEL